MLAYVIVDILVQDQKNYDEYKLLAPATVAAYEGKYLARGGKTEVLEGEWIPNRLVILEFPSLEQANFWFNSPEYAHPKEMRQLSTRTNMVVLEGV
jgi:uncharacterized protein (DUF1330 family)